MTQDDPAGSEPVSIERPTGAATLEIQLGLDKTARGSVPPEHAPHLIAAFGIVACVISGITGMVLTLHIAASLAGPAYAGLGLALAGAAMIAARRTGRRGPAAISADPNGDAGDDPGGTKQR
jgi:undecaprenyl pyrophosphate phosphatase UppP